MENDLIEYLELISYDKKQDLYKVFYIFYEKVDFTESDVNIYDFFNNYQKELTFLEEIGVIDYYFDDDEEEYFFSTEISQLEMAKLNHIFKEDLEDYY